MVSNQEKVNDTWKEGSYWKQILSLTTQERVFSSYKASSILHGDKNETFSGKTMWHMHPKEQPDAPASKTKV